MAYRKTVRGDNNQANETASHNRIQIETGSSLTIIAVYIISLVTGSLIFVAIVFGEYLKDAVVFTLASLFIAGWIYLAMFVRRGVSKTETVLLLDKMARSRAELEANIAVAMDNYAIFKDEEGRLQFRGTVQVTENRHYPAQIEAPKEPDATEGILTMWDGGSSAREIERWINRGKTKEEKISYHQIMKTLNTYRQGWQERSKKVVDAEEYPVDE